MDLRSYYKKLRDVERTITEEFPVIVSKETPEGGKPGVLTEVPRALAARLVAEGRAEVADAKAAARHREEAEEKKHAADQLLAASRLQVMVVPAESAKRPKGGTETR